MAKALAVNVLQVLLLAGLAPLVSGIIKKTKALLQTRRGPGILQPYFDLYKLLHKESVVSEHTSWIFSATPYIYLAAMLAVCLMLPVVSLAGLLNFSGDLILIIYLFALGRFFLALAGLDAGSAFGGMASSREMAVAAVAEPAVMLPLFTLAVSQGSTNLTAMVAGLDHTWQAFLSPAIWLAFVAFFIVAIAETGRIPVDNPDTHLELTMIHEGMLLEYSGRQLAMLTLGASLKQLVIFTLLANVFFPWGISTGYGPGSLAISLAAFLGKVIVLALAMAVIETSFAKMRLFKVPDLLMGSFLLSLLGIAAKFVFGG